MKLYKKAVIFLILPALAAVSFYFFYMRPRHVTPILVYHSIADDKESSLSVSPENFSRQMEFLKKNGYSVITLDELVKNINAGETYLPRTVVITFDDGYEDNFTEAFPVLAKHDMPAIIFLVTSYVDSKEEYLKWNQIRLMRLNKMDFGAHTRNNVYLPAVESEEELWSEVAGSKEDIEKATGKAADYFCYPTGGFNENVKLAVKKAGYKGACTTNRGFDRLNKDVFELNRVKITDSDMTKPFHFRAKLSGYYNLFRSYKSGD
ncbi:MAG: polysaccharide deacetylase family protein [Candidatus Omnitrophota bacterium]|jgi:peptidoglycan/xylan/chitin deacetylase (PgdA/CDA1 family)